MGDMAEANNLRKSGDKKPKKKKIKSQKKDDLPENYFPEIIYQKNNLPESGTYNDICVFSPKMEMTMILTQNGDNDNSHPKWR